MFSPRRLAPLAVLAVLAALAAPAPARGADAPAASILKGDQRLVVFLFDGFGVEYAEGADMPVLKDMAARGFSKDVDAVTPTVTNVNNASLATGAWPEEHGITGNSYFDEAAGRAEYMESAASLRRPTIFQRAAALGLKSALLTAKKKTVALLSGGATLAVAAEAPSPEVAARYGSPPPIYSREINYWLWEVAVDLLKNRPDLRLIYVHTTDYPMHTWAPDAPESKEHLRKVDELLGRARAAAPDAAFLITADHGMNHKSRCWNLAKACENRGVPVRFALSAERDRYVKHHRTFGGTAWLWLKSPADAPKVSAEVAKLAGVEAVLTREEAARRFHLMPERIGELVVLGDRETVFGETEGDSEFETLPPSFRTHGSLHEVKVPLIVYNASGELPPAGEVRVNFDLARGLYAAPESASPARALPPYAKPTLIAHRGASFDAPEHTTAAYELALKHGADFVEPDLQVTKDGVLVCLHDTTLERTTDVARRFPDRAKAVGGRKTWPVAEFTLEEIRTLDAGSWKGDQFAGARVPTFQEMLDLVRGKAGVIPETKAPEVYGRLGLDMEKLVMDALRKNSLDQPGADPRTPVVIQSFSAESLKALRQKYGCKLPLVYLVGQGGLSAERLKEVRDFADGVAPSKGVVLNRPGLVQDAHDLGMSVTVWTFRSGVTGRFRSVRDEMAHFLDDLKVDALFTDNPDQFPRD